MGGNGPSRFSAEEAGGGGVTFVKGIRLSDRVIDRMKHGSQASCPHASPEPQTQVTTPVPPPPVEQQLPLMTPPSPPFMTTPPTTPTQEAAPASPSVEAAPPVKLAPPPPVKFHSLPPPLLNSAAPSPPPEPEPPSVPENPEVPESHTPSLVVEPTVPPPPESFIPPRKEPETQTAPQKKEQIKEPVVPFQHGESFSSSELSSLSCEFVKPTLTEPAAVEPLDSAHKLAPQKEAAQVFASGTTPPVDPGISPSPFDSPPTEAGASPSETEKTPVVQGVHLSSFPPELSSDVASPSCQCEELAVVHTHVSEKGAPPCLEASPLTEPAPIAAEPPVTLFPAQDIEDNKPATVQSPEAVFPVSPEVFEEELRQKIRAEMQKKLEEEMNQKRQKLQQQLDEMQALTQAEVTAAAQAQVVEQVKKAVEAERATHMEKLTESIAREKMKAEDEKLMVQLYWMELKARQLEETEKEMKKREELYKEHVSKLEAKCADFYKVSAENFQKGKEETQRRFVRFNTQPLCGDLQGQILKCYKENPGRTLTCSGIASAYMQCVDNAKKDKLITGG